MNERELRGLLSQVKKGSLSRRSFIRKMAVVGLTAPMATQLLADLEGQRRHRVVVQIHR